MSTQPQQRYEVVERLDAGGMAEVFRAKARSLQGFEKQVAIKRVLPNLAKNEKFVKMFLDEARLSLHLSHANIVSVFDIGQAGGSYFIVMEFVDGANLKRFIEAARKRDGRVPLPLALYIGARICEGLQYAHEKRDSDRRPLNIVHRDISPPNVLLSWQGEVKLTDFGLAKATSQVELTDPGVVKGKFGYLSPEAAFGEPVDARTDVFATGIVVWEMLAGRRLFQGQTDIDTLHKVRGAEVPSLRQVNPGVDDELERILARALARDKAARYSSAREFGTALSNYLVGRGITTTSYDLTSYMEQVLAGAHRPVDEPPSVDAQSKVVHAVIEDQINKLIRVATDDMEALPARSAGAAFEDPRTWRDMGFDPATGPVAAQLTASGSQTAVREGQISGHYAAVQTPGAVTISNPTTKVTTRRMAAVTPHSTTPPPGMAPETPQPARPPTPQAVTGRPGTQLLPAAVSVRPAPPPPGIGASTQPAQAASPGEVRPHQATVRAGNRNADPRVVEQQQRVQHERALAADRVAADRKRMMVVMAAVVFVVIAACVTALLLLR